MKTPSLLDIVGGFWRSLGLTGHMMHLFNDSSWVSFFCSDNFYKKETVIFNWTVVFVNVKHILIDWAVYIGYALSWRHTIDTDFTHLHPGACQNWYLIIPNSFLHTVWNSLQRTEQTKQVNWSWLNPRPASYCSICSLSVQPATRPHKVLLPSSSLHLFPLFERYV